MLSHYSETKLFADLILYQNLEQRSTTSSIVPETVMRLKPVGLGVSGATREAEALRKDPFKNYKDL